MSKTKLLPEYTHLLPEYTHLIYLVEYDKIVTNRLQKLTFEGDFMNEIKDYIVYPENIKIYTPPTLPAKQDEFYTSLVYNLSRFILKFIVREGSEIKKIGMDDLKPPYILLCNHNPQSCLALVLNLNEYNVYQQLIHFLAFPFLN